MAVLLEDSFSENMTLSEAVREVYPSRSASGTRTPDCDVAFDLHADRSISIGRSILISCNARHLIGENMNNVMSAPRGTESAALCLGIDRFFDSIRDVPARGVSVAMR